MHSQLVEKELGNNNKKKTPPSFYMINMIENSDSIDAIVTMTFYLLFRFLRFMTFFLQFESFNKILFFLTENFQTITFFFFTLIPENECTISKSSKLHFLHK